MKSTWINSKTGEPIHDENGKISDKVIEAVLRNYAKKFTPPQRHTLSLLEIVFCQIINSALKNARKHKIRSTSGQAMFIVGYLSSRLNLSEIEFKFKKEAR